MSLKKKKIFTCTPECFTVFKSVYIKMCMCDQVYFVPDLLRRSECEKMFIFVNERSHLCIYM